MNNRSISLFFTYLLPLLTVILHSSLPSPLWAAQQTEDRLSCEPILCDLIQEKVTTDLGVAAFDGFKDSLRRFYQMNDMKLAWFDKRGKPVPQAFQVADILADAGSKGLDPNAYGGNLWQHRLAEIRDREFTDSGKDRLYRLAPVDAGLSVSLMRYASDLRLGRINPISVGADLNVEEKRFDLATALFEHLHDTDIRAALKRVEPPYRGYWELLHWLGIYTRLSADSRLAEPLPVTATVHPGENYSALPELEYRLKLYGDFPAEDETGETFTHNSTQAAVPSNGDTVYTGPVVEAVKHFQARHGLTPDGLIGKNTFAALNVPPATRVEQIKLSLERWRWLPDEAGNRIIVVNLPQFRLFGLEKAGKNFYEPEVNMKVIIGQAFKRHQTPIFTGMMRYVVFSPYWNVPYSILKKELLPKIRHDHGYLAKHNYEIVKAFTPQAEALPVNQETISGLARGTYHLRQKPGPENALGPIKFIFPNKHTIFLHGTPAQNLFRLETRAFSHGCIRVEHPDRLAVFVLKDNDEGEWTLEKVHEVMDSKEWQRVNLKTPLPVFIFYNSAESDRRGGIMFFQDIYGYDKRLKEAILALGQSL
jgi:murein L,D-transpeptidase YcbB/YkuD